MDTYTLYAVDVNGTLIDGIKSQSIGHNVQKVMNRNDGSPHVRFTGVMSSKPTISFTTVSIAKALDAVSALGVAISANVTMFFQKNAEGGLRTSGTNHLKIVVAAGIVVPRTARASQDGEAEITVEVIPTSSDGTTSPITYTASQALAGSPNVTEKFTLGPCTANGVDLEPQSLEIDFGLEVQTRSHSGHVFPVRASVKETGPKITVNTLNVGLLSTYGTTGVAQGDTDSVFIFRKLSENGDRVSDATAQHVSFTVDDGHIHAENADASDNEDAGLNVMVDPTYDGTNLPMVLDTTAAIS